MTRAQSKDAADPPGVVVAGHICLDIIPVQPPEAGRRSPGPGALDPIGPAALSVGGCVGNTGIALHRLGLRPVLVARLGDDHLGRVLADLVHDAVPSDATRLRVVAGGMTSYSLVWSQPGADRAIQHFPGVNDTFVSRDVPGELLRGATLLHVGYPPLMAAMVADDGRELRLLLRKARRLGVITSVDMASVHRGAGGGPARWRRLLERVLPAVDVFMPSLAEASHMLGRRVHRTEQGAPSLSAVAGLADEILRLGAAIAGIKLGEHGLYVRTAPAARLAATPRLGGPDWSDRELWSGVFESQVEGTTGAGDATIAGFLYGLLGAMSPEEAVTAACATGGSSTEAADGTSSVPSWQRVERRLRHGWPRRAAQPGVGWEPSAEDGVWRGPRDRA